MMSRDFIAFEGDYDAFERAIDEGLLVGGVGVQFDAVADELQVMSRTEERRVHVVRVAGAQIDPLIQVLQRASLQRKARNND